MSKFSDNILKITCYLALVVLILVLVIIFYMVYTVISARPPSLNEASPSGPSMEESLRNDLDQTKGIENNGSYLAAPDASGETPLAPNTGSPNVSKEDSYNPFEDEHKPVADQKEIEKLNQSDDFSSSVEDNSAKQKDSKEEKPMDPTNKSSEPDLDLLF